MARRNKNTTEYVERFTREYSMQVDGFTIEAGDIIKIVGEYGLRFRFESLTTNPEINSTWVDCIELDRGVPTRFRSFAVDRVKRIPKKRTRKVKKNVV